MTRMVAAYSEGGGDPVAQIASHLAKADSMLRRLIAEDIAAYQSLADSTRKEPGSAHTDFGAVVRTLKAGRYKGAVSLECGLSGPAEKVLPKTAALLKDLRQ